MSLSFQTKIDLFQVFEGHCGYCGEKLAFDKMTIDHIFPRCFGGGDGFDNLICCCKRFDCPLTTFKERFP